MMVFVSWSGELSNKVAELLKKYLPCIVNSIEVFFSSEDIEKGVNWDTKVSCELSKCNYGIICLTQSNMNAPWINFEAGAIAKSLDARVTSLMIDIKPSDIQGPLVRYQATKLEKDEIFQLVKQINNLEENPVKDATITTSFNAIWTTMNEELSEIIKNHVATRSAPKSVQPDTQNNAIEEILQLVRKQSILLSNPETLFPYDQLSKLISKPSNLNKFSVSSYRTLYSVIDALERLIDKNCKNSALCEDLTSLRFELMRVTRNFEHLNPELYHNESRYLPRTMVDAPASELRISETEERHRQDIVLNKTEDK